MKVKNRIDRTFYMIHTCPEREWFVEKYLIPDMIAQGIDKTQIIIYNDTEHVGNLKAFISSLKILEDYDPKAYVIHLQDDIIISSRFKELISVDYKQLYDTDVVCGFCSNYSNSTRQFIQKAENMWFSFPCIKFSNKLASSFITWINSSRVKKQYKELIASGKNDDLLFKNFLIEKGIKVLNLNPNVVNHVDFMLNGSLINTGRGRKNVMSTCWNDQETLDRYYNACVDGVLPH